MTQRHSNQDPEAWTRNLRWAFFLIMTGFLLGTVVSILAIWNIQGKVRMIVDYSLSSIELISRLSRDFSQKRLLFDAHIGSTEETDMNRIEREMADDDARIAETSLAYEATIDDDVERSAWNRLQEEIAAIDPKTRNVIELSRQNHDAAAQAAMKTIESDLDAIDQSIAALIRINSLRATQESARIGEYQRIAVVLSLALASIWMVFAFLVARWVTRLIRQREVQVTQALELLAERNQELDAFAGRVAHDLRAPLTAITLAASATPEASAEGPNAILRRSVKQMATIIQDLLMLSRSGAEIRGASCQAASAAALAEQDLRPMVQAIGGVLQIEAAAAAVTCTEGLLREVLRNLGENAVKYRRSGVQLRVEIRGRVIGDTYEFSVTDNGLGMSREDAERAFDPFFRAEHVRSKPGTGLGLSIVRRAVEACGGSVKVESVVGQGTRFTLHLRLSFSKAA